MILTEAALLNYLREQQIPFVRVEHPPVFTCAEAAQYRPALDGLDTKNLFLRDEQGRFYLAVTACEKRLDLKSLGRAVGAPKLRFGSADMLLELLGLTPGSVTVLGLVNDTGRCIRLLVDAEYWPAAAYLCHPLVNTATLALDHQALVHFLAKTGHVPQVVLMPAPP